MLGQVKLREQPLPGSAAVLSAGEPGGVNVGLRDARARRRRVFALDGRARAAQRLKQHLRPHALYAELTLLGGSALAPLLAGHVRDICVLDLRRVDRPAQIVADDKARPVAVREDDDAARFGQAA